MLKRFLAAFAAIMMLGFVFASPALADEGDEGRRVWVTATSAEDANTQILAIIVRGDEACFGSPRNHVCYGFNPVTRELRLQEVMRPRGVSKNIHLATVIQLDSGLVVQRNEAGVVVARFQMGTEQMNGTAMLVQGLTSMLPAATNGLLPSLVQATIGPCANGSCGGGGGATAISISDSAAQTLFQGVIGGGCSTGTCGTTPASGHTDD
jgi:hypothetical protein